MVQHLVVEALLRARLLLLLLLRHCCCSPPLPQRVEGALVAPSGCASFAGRPEPHTESRVQVSCKSLPCVISAHGVTRTLFQGSTSRSSTQQHHQRYLSGSTARVSGGWRMWSSERVARKHGWQPPCQGSNIDATRILPRNSSFYG